MTNYNFMQKFIINLYDVLPLFTTDFERAYNCPTTDCLRLRSSLTIEIIYFKMKNNK